MAEKIVVVEDDKDIQFLLKSTLSKAGYDVQVLSDGHALINFGAKGADLFLLDVNLPGISGLELCRLLKHNSITRHIPVILLSAFPGLKNVAPKYEADDAMEKPFDFASLINMITKHLAKSAERTATD